jgi:molecular chaperone IbpA
MNQLVRFDTNTLNRALVGFDRIFNDFENRYANSTTNYPPYNILKSSDNLYEIVLAVAGFEKHEITVEIDQDQLIVRGQRAADSGDQEIQYLHRGLGFRDFERRFTLAEHMEVVKASTKNGLLSVHIERKVPEALLPRKVEILELKD